MNTHNIGVRMQVVGGSKMKAEFAQIGQAGTRSLKSIEGASRSSSFALQNAAFQVGDFFVQTASGTSATRALSQQMPQLLGSFGLFGALAGAAFAALAPLVGSLFDAADEVETLDEVMKGLDASTRAFQAAAKASRVSVSELAQTYGELADEIVRARDNQEALTRSQGEGDIRSASDRIGTNVQAFALIAERRRLMDQLSGVGVLSEQRQAIRREVAEIQGVINTLEGVDEAVSDVAERIGIAADEAARVAEAAARLRDAGSIEESAQAADALAAELIASAGSAEAVEAGLPGILSGLGQIVERAGDMTAELGASADEAGRLARDFAAAQQRIAAAGRVGGGRGGDPRTSNQQVVGRFVYTGPALDANNNPIVRNTGAGRSGGVNETLREAERLFDQTRTAAERYDAEVARINDLHREFGSIVTDDVRDRALKGLQEDLKRTDGYARSAATAIRSAFDGIFDDPLAALENLGQQLLQLALFQQLAGSLPSVFGRGGIIPLTSFEGGGFTGSGARSGGLDGRGGFLSMLHPQETVTDHTKGGGAGVSVVVQNFSGAPSRAESTRGPDGREIIRVIVGEEIAKGGLDKPMKGRFAAAPIPVKR